MRVTTGTGKNPINYKTNQFEDTWRQLRGIHFKSGIKLAKTARVGV